MVDEKKPGLLVEDESVVGGVDAGTGAPVIRPKTPDGTADAGTIPTDEREAAPSPSEVCRAASEKSD